MKKEIRQIFEEAAKTPDVPLFKVTEAAEIAGGSTRVIREFEYLKIVRIPRNRSGYRYFSYDDIKFIISLKKLVKHGITMNSIKPLCTFLDKRGLPHRKFLADLAEYYGKYRAQTQDDDKE